MTWTCLLRITRRSSRVKVTVAERSMRVSTLVTLQWKFIAFDCWSLLGCGAVLDEWLWGVALCCWMSFCGVWCCVVGWVVRNIFKNHRAVIFSVIQPKKVKTFPSFEMLEAAGPMTDWHIKENWHIQYCVCFCKYSRTLHIRTLIIWIRLTLQVNLSRNLQNYLALKLPVIWSSTVQCYGL